MDHSSHTFQSVGSSSSHATPVICHRTIATGNATSPVVHSVAIDPVHRPVVGVSDIVTDSGAADPVAIDPVDELSCVGTDERVQKSSNVPSAIQTDPFASDGPEVSTQLSTQTFMKKMDKHFDFYRCENITINFQPTFNQK